jgi:hypothetical protein
MENIEIENIEMENDKSIDLDKGLSFLDLGLHGEHVNVKSSTIVKMYEKFTIITEDGPLFLDVSISADFNEVPQKYQEVFFNVLTSKYMNKVNFSNNVFSSYKPVKNKTWWELLITKYFLNK